MTHPASDAGIEPEGGWREHSRPNVDLRRKKAAKIVALLETRRPIAGSRILEIGTGSGVISSELARAAGDSGKVHSIDTMDTRLDKAAYEFRLTSGVRLPYEDDCFDIVVTNHVIEHVGGRADQQVHLQEISRVLQPTGLGYIATPTRWALVEPHYKVPLLSWPPRRYRDWYVRLARKGKVYNVDPFGGRELQRALDAVGFTWECVTIDALGELARIEQPTGVTKAIVNAPAALQRAIRPALPTMVYLVTGKA